MQTPVVLIVYKRPELARRTLECVAAAQPKELFVIADGPKEDDDTAAITRTREIFDDVSWPCTINRNFAEKNMGLRGRIESGLDWVFSQVDRAIILEDDCVPHPKFFPFCSEMLSRYADDPKISMVSGDNAHGVQTENSFYCSRYTLIWGWATWSRAWAKYNHGMTWWPLMRDSKFVEWMFRGRRSSAYWTKTLQDNFEGANSWARVWMMSNWLEETVCGVSSANLISNVGFGEDATHTQNINAIRSFADTREPLLPIKPPAAISPDDKADAIADRVIFSKDDRIFRGEKFQEKEVQAISAHSFLASLGLSAKSRVSLIAAALNPGSAVDLNDLSTAAGAKRACGVVLRSGSDDLQTLAVEDAARVLANLDRWSHPDPKLSNPAEYTG